MKLILLKTISIKAAIIKIVLFIGLEYVFLFLSFFLIAVRKKLKNKIYIIINIIKIYINLEKDNIW